MKIELEVQRITKTKAVYDVEFPVYLKQGYNDYYCFFDVNNYKKNIRLQDMSIGKSIDYFTDHYSIERILGETLIEFITKETFQNKLVEILSIINGAVDEMHTADEQQKGTKG